MISQCFFVNGMSQIGEIFAGKHLIPPQAPKLTLKSMKHSYLGLEAMLAQGLLCLRSPPPPPSHHYASLFYEFALAERRCSHIALIFL